MDFSSIIQIADYVWNCNQYVQALIIFVFFVAVANLVLLVFEKLISKATKKTKTELDDRLVEAVSRPLSFIVAFIGIKIALSHMELPEEWNAFAIHATDTFIIVIVAMLLIKFFDLIIGYWGKSWARKTRSKIDDQIVDLGHKVSTVVIMIFALLFILDEWGIDVTSLLAGLGIAGIAIGFAVKDSLANIFGGISLILDKAIRVGDFVKLDSGESGEIVDVGLRSTRMRTWDNELIIIPNGVLAVSKIQNWKLPNLSARCVINFGVEYGSNPDKVKKVIEKAIKKYHTYEKDDQKPDVVFMELGESSLNFAARFWVNDVAKRFDSMVAARGDIYKALNKAKIGIPFPCTTVYLKK